MLKRTAASPKGAPGTMAEAPAEDLTHQELVVETVRTGLRQAASAPVYGPAQVELPAFKAWFGKSKVAQGGKPMVVFHGTDAKTPFEAFVQHPDGLHFGTVGQSNARVGASATVIREAVRQRDICDYQAHRRLLPVYLSIQNPLEVADADSDWAAVIHDAKAMGHDGLKYRNRFEDGGRGWSWVIFEPTQAKSAVGNCGSFDPLNPDLRA